MIVTEDGKGLGDRGMILLILGWTKETGCEARVDGLFLFSGRTSYSGRFTIFRAHHTWLNSSPLQKHDIHIGSTPTAGLEPHQLPNPGSFPAAVCTAPNSRGMLRPLEWYPEEHSDGIKPVSESMLRSYLTKRHGCWDKSTTTIDGRVRSDEVDLGMTYR